MRSKAIWQRGREERGGLKWGHPEDSTWYGLEINCGLDASCSDVGTLRILICVALQVWGSRLAEGPRDERSRYLFGLELWRKGLTVGIKAGLYKVGLRRC